jgi:hypothetical protein
MDPLCLAVVQHVQGGGWEWGGAVSYDHKKAWSFMNNSILYDLNQNSSWIPCVLLLYNLLRGRGEGESLVLYK